MAEIDTQRQQLSDTLRIFEERVGAKNYELSNHLGNVLATISDKTIFNYGYYSSIVYSAQLYYPFGWEIPTLSYTAKSYRYGFNGVEKAREIGEGVNTTFYREQDTRAGRWWSFDPRPNAAVSPYAMMENNPIAFSDVLGDTLKIKPNSRDNATIFLNHYNSLDNDPDIKAALDILGSSDVMYEIILSSSENFGINQNGMTFIKQQVYNQNGRVVIGLYLNSGMLSTADFQGALGDEIITALQFENGDIGFKIGESGTLPGQLGADIDDELYSRVGEFKAVNAGNYQNDEYSILVNKFSLLSRDEKIELLRQNYPEEYYPSSPRDAMEGKTMSELQQELNQSDRKAYIFKAKKTENETKRPAVTVLKKEP